MIILTILLMLFGTIGIFLFRHRNLTTGICTGIAIIGAIGTLYLMGYV